MSAVLVLLLWLILKKYEFNSMRSRATLYPEVCHDCYLEHWVVTLSLLLWRVSLL